MTHYKLIDAISVPITMYHLASKPRNVITYDNYMRLEPGKTYVMPEDEILAKSITNYKVEHRYTAELEDALKACNAEYEVRLCKSCGGRVKKIKYKIVEVIENV